jgi:Tol biopolymer transport system component
MQRRAIYAWFPDGRVERVSPADGIYYQACIHPEGTDAIFFGASAGSPLLWKAAFAAGELTPLTDADAGARHPVYAWDGQAIAFASDRLSAGAHERIEDFIASTRRVAGDVTFNIFVADADGNQTRQITFGAYQDHRPSFSPDGQTVVFASNRDGAIRIWRAPADGSESPRQILTEGWGYRPWYSVDGQTIFFYSDMRSDEPGQDRICQMPAGGGPVRRLPNDDRGITHGAFADPAGECLLVHSTRSGEWGIWELPLDGSPMRQLQPPGYRVVSHATRSRNGVITFDTTQV